MKMARQVLGLVLVLTFLFSLSQTVLAQTRVKVAAIVASNDGSEFNLVNDDYRDELIKLFSYTRYDQALEKLIILEQDQDQALEIPGGYVLTLHLDEADDDAKRIRARIEKEGKSYLDTQISVWDSAPVFLGGPSAESGDLILVVEAGP